MSALDSREGGYISTLRQQGRLCSWQQASKDVGIQVDS